ncbi:hypothetical protein OsI_02234 [Oryza sativa Indica Group]|uniref:Uncharacterized protein n=1 Tax=Oryza sativa subsp. indica TaxID=39946 RepID=B8A9B0_ORYSI|nr:hypothetical protein OsI_02234 [Oryza sativa Indica Group]
MLKLRSSPVTAVRFTMLAITWPSASATLLQLSGLSMILLRIFTPNQVNSMLTVTSLPELSAATINDDTIGSIAGKLSRRRSRESSKMTPAACPLVFTSSRVLFVSPSMLTTPPTVSAEARSLMSASALYLGTLRMLSRTRTPTRRSAMELDRTSSMAKLTRSMFMASRTLPPEHLR